MSQSGLNNAESSNPQIPTKFDTDSGSAIPILNTLEILGNSTQGTTTSAAGNTLTISGIDSTAAATAVAAQKGVASFHNDHFTVTDGFVELSDDFGGVLGILTDDGAPEVDPNSVGQISMIGGNGIDVTGQGPGNTVTISAEDATVSNEGIGRLASNSDAIDGTLTSNVFINPSSLKAKLGAQTNHGLPIGAGQTSAITWTSALTNGQVLIGSTGVDPVLGAITSTGGTIDVTLGAGTINVEVVPGSGIPVTEVTGLTQQAAVNNAYITNNAAGVTVTLPATASVGDRVEIIGKDGLWVLAQNAGQIVHYLSQSSTTGAGGSWSALQQYNCLEVMCITANTTWVVIDSVGNIDPT